MSAEKASNQPKERILVVDDAPTTIPLLVDLLGLRGYSVHPATEGPLALELVRATSPDLILLEAHMPGMDGNEVCARLRADPRTREIPVILLSSPDRTLDKVEAFRSGAVDCITKPFDAEEVLARIETQLTLRRAVKELRQAEAALRESEARFRGTFENAAIGIAHKDLEGRFLLLNKTFCDIVGYERSELLGKRWHDITHPDDVPVSEKHYRRLASGEVQRFSLEKRYVRPDRSLAWVEVTVSLQRDEAGSPAYAIAIVEDISDRKRLQEALQWSKTQLELSVRGSNIRIWDIDMPDGNLLDSLISAVGIRLRAAKS